MAQIPVPVATSRTFLGFFTGASPSLPSKMSPTISCWKSGFCQRMPSSLLGKSPRNSLSLVCSSCENMLANYTAACTLSLTCHIVRKIIC